MSDKFHKGFACNECGGWEKNKEDAMTCCEPNPSESFMCSQCGAEYRTEEEAVECYDLDQTED